MNRKQFEEDVNIVRQSILKAIPTGDEQDPDRGIDFDAIIKALGQVIAIMIDCKRDEE